MRNLEYLLKVSASCVLMSPLFFGCGDHSPRNHGSGLDATPSAQTLTSPFSIPSVIQGVDFASATDGNLGGWGHCSSSPELPESPAPTPTPPSDAPSLTTSSATNPPVTARPVPAPGQDDSCTVTWPSGGVGLDYLVSSDSSTLQTYSIDLRLSSADKDSYITIESPPGEFRGNLSGYDPNASGHHGSQEKVPSVVRTISGIPISSGQQVVRLLFHGVTAVSYLDFHRDFDEGTAPIVWSKADLTNYTSYPDPMSEECIEYNGCVWAGWFAALDAQQTEGWVKAHNIIAVHSKHFEQYKLKTFRIKKGSKQIDAKVYDMCADSDCDGCCTENSKRTGFLIDLESYGVERSGLEDGVVEWRCLDCPSLP